MQTWHLIPLLEAPGAVQMALDEWLLNQHQQGLQPPTLRFYTWKPSAISLGYHQHQWATHWQQLTWQGQPLELVRRPTGGRAVLHQGDLTYAVITSGLGGNRMQAYQKICAFLIEGWRSLGVDLHYGQAGRGYIHNPNCFGTATRADLVTTDGAKLVGSAQLHRKNAILQHGSMPLQPSADLFRQVFETEPAFPTLPLHQTGEALLETVTAALTRAAEQEFQTKFQLQPLTQTDWQAALQHRLQPNLNSNL